MRYTNTNSNPEPHKEDTVIRPIPRLTQPTISQWREVARRFPLALSALLIFATVALATVVQENVASISKTSGRAAGGSAATRAPTLLAAYTGLSESDSTTWTGTAITGRRMATYGDPYVEVTVLHSAAAATACVVCGVRDEAGNFQGVAGISTSTAGAGATLVTDGTSYYGEKLRFSVAGWSYYELRVLDASGSSTVSLKPATVGATSAAAE